MSNIPTKGQVAIAQATKVAAAHEFEDARVRYVTDNIVACMIDGEKTYLQAIGKCSRNVKARVRSAFAAQGWTIWVWNFPLSDGFIVIWS